MRYKKKPTVITVEPVQTAVLGMLYVVDVRLVKKDTKEIIKHRLLLVGCEQGDIERKMRWMFDNTVYAEMSISGIEKVREKVHFISTVVTQHNDVTNPIIDRDGRSMIAPQQSAAVAPYDPKFFAVGLATTIIAKDKDHAVRKVGRALIAHATEGKSHEAPALSEDSTLIIEEVPRSSGYAMPRDVSNEINEAFVMRG